MNQSFKKSISRIPIEEAHGGSGSRQRILSKDDTISQYLHAMTKGYLPVGGVFDWHNHENIDEICLVIEGSGMIEFEDGTIKYYQPDDLLYIASNIKHRITNTGSTKNIFFFIRIDA